MKLLEVYGFVDSFPQPGDLCRAPGIISLSPLSLATNVTEVTLGTSGLWLGTRTGGDDTATLVSRNPHGSMGNRDM